MKSLAEFIVRSPWQAAVVVAVATASLLLSWVGAAALGLYLLRFGISTAAPVVLAGILPAAFWVSVGDIGPLLTHGGVIATAMLLRQRANWPDVLVALPVILAALCLLVVWVAPDYVSALQLVTATFVEEFKQQMLANPQADAELVAMLQAMRAPSGEQLMGMMALLQAAMVLMCLCLARWWQALLFNQGGFRQEIHSLRLGRLQVLVLVACFIGLLGSSQYSVWGWVFILPLVFAGMALVHGLFGIARLTTRWLVLFYAVLILIRPAMGILVALAVLDSALDFRGRLRQRLPR